MENLTTHLLTISSIIAILWIIIFLPWLVGRVVGRIVSDENKYPERTWITGVVAMFIALLLLIPFYYIYIEIFNFYSKP